MNFVVTGAGKGIGRATALYLGRQGHAVALWDRDAHSLSDTVELMRNENIPALSIEVDTTSEEDVQNAANRTRRDIGAVHGLVNNVGIQTYGTVEETSQELWNLTLSVNVGSAFLCSKHLVPAIREAGGGAIVNVSSAQALASQARVAAYTASKGALLALTREMAVDYAADRIRVNAVCPGSVDTPMLRDSAVLFSADDPESAISEWGKQHLLGRAAQPQEIAEVIWFLLEKASFMTGSAVVVDGGLLAKLL